MTYSVFTCDACGHTWVFEEMDMRDRWLTSEPLTRCGLGFACSGMMLPAEESPAVVAAFVMGGDEAATDVVRYLRAQQGQER